MSKGRDTAGNWLLRLEQLNEPPRESVMPELWPHSELPVRELKVYDTGDIFLVDGDYDGELYAQFPWRLVNGYLVTWVQPEKNKYLHHLVYGKVPAGKWVTFRNGNHLDCRSANITIATPGQIAAKRPVGSGQPKRVKGGGVTGYIGVQPYQWPIHVKGVQVGLTPMKYKVVIGHKHNSAERGWIFDTAEEAARKYDELAIEKWGDFAQLNFPREH